MNASPLPLLFLEALRRMTVRVVKEANVRVMRVLLLVERVPVAGNMVRLHELVLICLTLARHDAE